MKPYYETDLGKLYCGDCLEVMRTLPGNSVKSMITDPPYGLSFMGKKWDYDVPSIEIWRECLRVLKPGAHALIFAGSRTQHRMAVNVEDAGFRILDTLMWVYGSGFPKSINISKALDKAAGKEREVVGKYRIPVDSDAGNAGKILRSVTQNGGCFDATSGKEGTPITAPATPEAELWDGWGTHLKPSFEPIILAMKPNDGSYAQNALKHGVAGINVDECRIDSVVLDNEKRTSNSGTSDDLNFGTTNKRAPKFKGERHNPKGRFPANVIFDEEAARLLDQQSGELKSGGGIKSTSNKYVYRGQSLHNSSTKGDGKNFDKSQGGASRFFYCPKASKSDRGDGNNHPTVKPIKLIQYLVTLLSYPEDNLILDPFGGSGTTAVACENLKRRWIMCEKSEAYCEIAARRIEETASQMRF